MLTSRMPAIAMPRMTSIETMRSFGREAVGRVVEADASFTVSDRIRNAALNDKLSCDQSVGAKRPAPWPPCVSG